MSYQLTRVEERNVTQNETPATQDRAKFGISCKAGGVTTLTTTADSLAIEAAVRISRSNATELWPCVGIYSREEEDGSLGVQIVAFHPNWKEPKHIAYVRSPSHDSSPPDSSRDVDLEPKT